MILVVQKFLLEITEYGKQIRRVRAGLYKHRLLNKDTAHAAVARIPYLSGSARKAWFTIDEKGRDSKAQGGMTGQVGIWAEGVWCEGPALGAR